MTSLSNEFISNLLKKANRLESGHKPIFTEDEVTVIRWNIKEGRKRFELRNRIFVVRYFTWRKQDWVTVRPFRGFVPMFSMPVSQVLNKETVI